MSLNSGKENLYNSSKRDGLEDALNGFTSQHHRTQESNLKRSETSKRSLSKGSTRRYADTERNHNNSSSGANDSSNQIGYKYTGDTKKANDGNHIRVPPDSVNRYDNRKKSNSNVKYNNRHKQGYSEKKSGDGNNNLNGDQTRRIDHHHAGNSKVTNGNTTRVSRNGDRGKKGGGEFLFKLQPRDMDICSDTATSVRRLQESIHVDTGLAYFLNMYAFTADQLLYRQQKQAFAAFDEIRQRETSEWLKSLSLEDRQQYLSRNTGHSQNSGIQFPIPSTQVQRP